MVSKNNFQQHQQAVADRVPHYGIRKLSVGVASVLLSTTLYMGVTAHADTTVSTSPQPTVDQPANTTTGTSTSDVTADAQPTAGQPASTATPKNDASAKSAPTALPKQPANATDAQPTADHSSRATNSPTPENDMNVKSAPTALPKQPANADTQSAATTSGVQPFVNLAVESDNNDLTPKKETVDSQWTIHYVNSTDHKQELKDPTVITMQYERTNTPQSDGTTQYGDWSYVPGSFKQTGTLITVNDSDNPVKQDNTDKNGENMDVFTITAMYPTIAGYDFHNGINGTRLRDNLRNSDRQADTMSKDFYAEYDVAKLTQETVTSKWTIHYVNSTDHKQELKAPTVITMQYTRTNIPQSDGTIQYGDWSYVPGSFKQTGTPITVNDSDNPVKQDNTDKNGENMDVFTITAMYPTIAGHTMHNGINGTRLSDNLRNDDRQAAMMSKDTYAEYDVAKERSVTVKFVDDQLSQQQVGQAITLTDRDGDTVDLNLTVPDSDKYRLADGQQLPTTYTFTAGSGDLTIHLAHKAVQREATIDVKLALITEVNIDSIDHTSAVISQTQWGQLDDGLKHGKPEFISPAGVFPLVEAGTLTGHVNYDLVNNEFVSFGNDWTNLNLGGHTYQLPNGDDVVNGVLVGLKDSWGEPLKKYYLKYHPNVDPDYATYPWHGYLSVNVTSDPNGPLADWNGLGLQGGLAGNKSNILAKANGDRAATAVEMANKTIDVSFLPSPNGFREQDGQLQRTLLVPVVGVYVPYVEKTVTRTINVTTPDGKMTMVKQTATLAKQVNFNKDADPAWTTGEWASYDAPSLPGYTASQPNLAQQTVTGATEDQTVNITYIANPQTTTVVYQTEDGTSVHTTTVNGKTGQTVTVPNEVPAGWQIVNGEVPSKITFGSDGAPKAVVTIVHSHVTVTSDAPKTTSDKLPDNPDKDYLAGVGETDLNKAVTRTIKVTTPDGQTKTVEQTAKLTRTADVDEVTGEVKYSDWSTGQWDKYDVPIVPGYTPSQFNIVKETVTDTTKDQAINITYTANDHQISVEYVDNVTGQVVKTDHVSGKTGQTVPITPHVPDGWELVSDQSVPSEVALGADGAPTTVIKVQPQERSVTVKFVDDQSFDWYGYGTDYKKQVGQAVTVTGRDGDTVDLKLTVPDKYQLADGQKLPTTYTFTKDSGDVTIHLKHQVAQREAAIDVQLALITSVHFDDNGFDQSVITQAQWNQLDDELKSHAPGPQDILYPLVKVGTLTGHVGYDLVNGYVVSFGDDWTTLKVGGRTYQLPNGTEIVNGVVAGYVASFGKKLKSVILSDDPDVDPDYVNRPWHGYLSVSATNNSDAFEAEAVRREGLQAGLVGDEPNALTKATSDRAAIGVEMSAKTIDLGWLQDNVYLRTNDFSEQDGQLRAKKFLLVMGAYVPYVEKTATRMINVTAPDGKTTTVKQTATLAKQVDLGKDAHAAWTTGEWTSYEVPTISGYTASQFSIAKETVTGTTEDQTVDITYTANPQTTHVNYVDAQGNLIHTTTVNGQTDQTVVVPSEVPTGWKLVDGQTVPSEVTFGPDGRADTSVKIEHQHVTVTPDAPKTADDQLPDNPTKNYPGGVDEINLNKMVTRTIKIMQPDGTTTEKVQTVHLTRSATVDEVTKEVKYGAWSTGQWDAYEVPTVDGYAPSRATVEAAKVDGHTLNQTVTITYKQITHPSVETAIKTLTEHFIYGEGDRQGKVAAPDSQIKLFFKRTNQVTTDGTVVSYGQWELDPSQGTNGYQILSGQWQIPTPGNYDVLRAVAELPNGKKLSVDENREYHYSSSLAWLNPELSAVDYFTDPDFYDVRAEHTTYVQAVHVDLVLRDQDPMSVGNPYVGRIHLTGYADDSRNLTWDDIVAAGKHDKVDLTNYELVPDQTVSVDFEPQSPNTVTSADGQTVQIHVKHHQVTTSESKTVTRTINVHTPHDGVKTVKQTVMLNRDVTTDQVTGDKTYGGWTTGQWKAYTPEAIPGYTPSTNEVLNVNVNSSSNDNTVDVTYVADAQKVEIVYVDDAKGGAVVKTDQVAGKTDETVKVTSDVPAGYNVVGEVPGSYTMTSDGHQTITVHLGHQTKTISENKTVTRTINVHTPHDGVKTIKQTAKLTRNVTTDQVTGEKTYGDWSATLWDHYAVPAVAGYVPSIKQVAQQVVNGTTMDQMVNVTYSSGEHTTHVNYVDGDGNIVHITTIKGQTDGTAQVPNETPAGWTVVGESVPTELAFGPDGHADVTVTISHKHVTVTSDHPKTLADKLPDNPAKSYPNGVGYDDLNKTITRTLKITTPDGQTKTTEQAAKLTRTADVDEVTGKVTYGNWTTSEWSNYDVPTVPGYTPSQSEVPTTEVDNNTKDQTVTIGYTANDHTTTIDYIDQNGKTVHATVVNGHTDQTVKVPNETPAGWTITNGQVPTEITFGPDGRDRVIVTVDHQHVTVTSDNPQTDGTKLPDNPSETFRGVAESDLNKTITRTIEVATPAGKTDTIKQAAKLTRTADVDEVTGEVIYGKWTTGAWSSYSALTVPGYTPSQAVVAEAAVYADMTDQTVKITYTADSHTTHINYVDEGGTVIRTTTITGHTDQTIKVPNETPAGWTTTGQVPNELTFGPDGYTDVTITVDHRHVTVTPDDPKTDGAKLPDNSALTFHDVDHDDLNKTITRTIKLNVPGQDPQVITQTARLTRKATVDEVTGEVTYGGWTSGQWDAYEVPAVDGYIASQTAIPAVKVTSETTSQDIVIDYVAVPTTQTTSSNNQTDEKQLTPEKVVTVTNGTVQETKQYTVKNPVQSTIQDTKQLPQTGSDNRAGLLSLIGSSLMASLAIFGLGKKKKHEN